MWLACRNRPVRLVYVEYVGDKISALKREWKLKHTPAREKRKLIEETNADYKDLCADPQGPDQGG